MFERQKNDRKANTVTQWWTSDDHLCPIKIWPSKMRRILSYKGTNKNSPVPLVKYKNNIIKVTAEMTADVCRDKNHCNWRDKLGILRAENGTRSIHLGAAMAMYLAGVFQSSRSC
jgi:hypothetical protein